MMQRKVCLVGDFAVGKTSLFNQFVYTRFSDQYLSTVGVRVQRKVVTIEQTDLALILWDTEGGREQATIAASALRGAAGMVVVCDLSRVMTILHTEQYITQLRATNPALPIVLAGNKLDLVGENHAHVAVARRISQAHAVPLFLTSAHHGQQVEQLFAGLAQELLHARVVE